MSNLSLNKSGLCRGSSSKSTEEKCGPREIEHQTLEIQSHPYRDSLKSALVQCLADVLHIRKNKGGYGEFYHGDRDALLLLEKTEDVKLRQSTSKWRVCFRYVFFHCMF